MILRKESQKKVKIEYLELKLECEIVKDEMRGRVLVKQSYDKRVTTTEKE